MKLELTLPAEGLDANIRFFDAKGNIVNALIERIEISPIFYRADQKPPVLFGVVIAGEDGTEGKQAIIETHRFVVQVSGAKGLCTLTSRSEPVLSAFETKLLESREEDDEADDD